jgi:hypothetical protein
MNPIPKLVEEFTYAKIQPGDGTIYTIMYGPLRHKESLYIAIGAGETVEHGYSFRLDSGWHMLNDLRKWIENDTGSTIEFVESYHLFAYHDSHWRSDHNYWTMVVLVLLSAIMSVTWIEDDESALSLIELMDSRVQRPE